MNGALYWSTMRRTALLARIKNYVPWQGLDISFSSIGRVCRKIWLYHDFYHEPEDEVFIKITFFKGSEVPVHGAGETLPAWVQAPTGN